jgi:hypothetical protein
MPRPYCFFQGYDLPANPKAVESTFTAAARGRRKLALRSLGHRLSSDQGLRALESLKVMLETSVCISNGSMIDSPPTLCGESPRHRCAGATPGTLSIACEGTDSDSLASHRGESQICLARGPDSFSAVVRLSHLVRAVAADEAASRARSIKIPASDLWKMHCTRSFEPGTTAGPAQGQTARGMCQSSRRSAPRGPQNRSLLPPYHPYPRSRSYEEGNVDQCFATGGMPHRDH